MIRVTHIDRYPDKVVITIAIPHAHPHEHLNTTKLVEIPADLLETLLMDYAKKECE